jgi:hypothetical protein
MVCLRGAADVKKKQRLKHAPPAEEAVPLRWHAKTEGHNAYISKLSCTAFSKSPASGFISLWPVESPPKTETDKDLAYPSFTSVYWTYLTRGAGETIGPLRKGTGERSYLYGNYSHQRQMDVFLLSCIPGNLVRNLLRRSEGAWVVLHNHRQLQMTAWMTG